ncbi:GHMP kinase [Sphingobacteriales bacterium UPWRP_1]|nr:hypothetical protein B6N25_15365 [Sphingobacteriales bacterium TSM_CSS]PSJ78801.1 GHMP kinase [Sphingobacteriales bacterium UPWRP_1]
MLQHPEKQPVLTTSYRSNGKLLLTGEYFVLEGASALALPTQKGQTLTVNPLSGIEKPVIDWQSFTPDGQCWFSASFSFPQFEPFNVMAQQEQTARKLQHILQEVRRLNPRFLENELPLQVQTHLEFHSNWGLGSSSTLINNIAQWAQADAYQLQFATFGGSGYDIACAMHNTPLLYRKWGTMPHVQPVNFYPPFSDCMYFVYLGQKQNSRQGIQHFYRHANNRRAWYIQQIEGITQAVVECTTLPQFETLLNRHEQLVSEALNLPMVKPTFFAGYWGAVKSLGAWGGDFVLACSAKSPTETHKYFSEKGFTTVIPYAQMIKPRPV